MQFFERSLKLLDLFGAGLLCILRLRKCRKSFLFLCLYLDNLCLYLVIFSLKVAVISFLLCLSCFLIFNIESCSILSNKLTLKLCSEFFGKST